MRNFILATSALTVVSLSAADHSDAATVTLKAGANGLFASGLGSVNGSTSNRYLAGGDGNAGDSNGFGNPSLAASCASFDTIFCENSFTTLELGSFFSGADLLSARGAYFIRTHNGSTPVPSPSDSDGRNDQITIEGQQIYSGNRVNRNGTFNVSVGSDNDLDMHYSGSGVSTNIGEPNGVVGSNRVDVDIFVTECSSVPASATSLMGIRSVAAILMRGIFPIRA